MVKILGMSQLVSFPSPKKPQELTKVRLTLNASENECVMSKHIIVALGYRLESYAKNIQPVKVVNDTIKVKEYLLEENKPYAFQYHGKDYIITKTADRTKLYELRD